MDVFRNELETKISPCLYAPQIISPNKIQMQGTVDMVFFTLMNTDSAVCRSQSAKLTLGLQEKFVNVTRISDSIWGLSNLNNVNYH